MINRNPRNLQLLSQISDANPFKKTIIPRLFDLGSDFEKDMEATSLDRRLSPDGKKEKAQSLAKTALRDLRNAKKLLDEHHAKTESMRAKVKAPPYDRTDVAGALLRAELRQLARGMSLGQRQMRMVGEHRDQNFVDAVLELEGWCSGFDMFNPNEATLYEEARQSRLRDLYAGLLDQIAERDSMEQEVLIVANVLHNDLEQDAGLGAEFERIAKRVSTGADEPWVTSDRTQVVEVQLDGTATYRPASKEEAENGRLYSLQAYQAARAA